MDGVWVLLLFSIFAVCILSVLLTGADGYRRQVDRDAASYSRRTAVQYIATKVRSGDRLDGMEVCALDGAETGNNVLVLRETVNGQAYETRIYCYKGYIRELFSVADGTFSPEDGTPVLKAGRLIFSLDEGSRILIVETADENGTESELTLTLRSGEVAV